MMRYIVKFDDGSVENSRMEQTVLFKMLSKNVQCISYGNNKTRILL